MNLRLKAVVTAAVGICGMLLINDRASAAKSAAIWDANASPGLAALQAAAEQGQYAFVFFWKDNSEPTQRMYQTLNAGTAKMTGVHVVGVAVMDAREQKTVAAFGADRAPLPLIAAVAPNGAVTKAWPLQIREEQLQEGIVSEATARCMKALQDQKLVLLCVYNAKMPHSASSVQAAVGFKADPRFAAAAEIVTLDPTDAREAAFLRTLQVNPRTPDAVTVLLAPPGRPLAQFAGTVTTQEIVAKVTSAQSGCCPGGKCGPGGCGPGGQCGPAK